MSELLSKYGKSLPNAIEGDHFSLLATQIQHAINLIADDRQLEGAILVLRDVLEDLEGYSGLCGASCGAKGFVPLSAKDLGGSHD